MESTPVEPTRMRKAIARRMSEAKSQIPHFYVSTDIIMDDARLALELVNRDRKHDRVTVTAVIIKALAQVLEDNPSFNAHWAEGRHTLIEQVNVAVAVEVEDGLVAPAILDCSAKKLTELADELDDVSSRTRAGKARPDEMTQGTFTLSNLGMFDITGFTAIVNPPQVAILAVGRGEERAIVCDGEVVVANVGTFTLSADHRAVDGAMAARFLSDLKLRLENARSMIEISARGRQQ